MYASFVPKVSNFFITTFMVAMLTVQPTCASSNSFINETNSFGPDPTTQHGFAWSLPVSVDKSWIEYGQKNSFTSFSAKDIMRIDAIGSVTKNDGGKRQIFKCNLNNLLPHTSYIYRLVASEGSVSPTGTFLTGSNTDDVFTFLSITDTQGSNAKDYMVWGNTLSKAMNRFPDARFLVHTGDIVDKGDSITQWDEFVNAAQPLLLNLPIVPVVGNHDVLNRNKTNEAIHNYTDVFDTPQLAGTGAVEGTVYAFDYGNAHIAVMNTECSSKSLAAQAKWLLQDMKKSEKPWKIVALHRGPYGGLHNSSDIRSKWVPTFDLAGIDLVLEGHDHNYIRTFPMKNGLHAALGNGTVYIDSNTGGVKYYKPTSQPWQAIDLQPHKQMYLAVTVESKVLTVQAFDVSGKLVDSIKLKKE